MHRGMLVVAGVIIVACCAGGAMADDASAQPENRTVTGVTYPVPADVQSELLPDARDAADRWGYGQPSNLSYVITEDGDRWIVGTTSLMQAGKVTVSGPSVTSSDAENGLLLATSIEREPPTEVEFEQLRDNTAAYDYEYVETTATATEVAYRYEIDPLQSQQTFGATHTGDGVTELLLPPGRAARYLVYNMTEEEGPSISSTRGGAIEKTFLASGSPNASYSHRKHRWWTDARSQVRLLVLPAEAPTRYDGRIFYTADVSPLPETTLTPEELRANPERYEGDVVAVEGDAIGGRVSAKESLLAVAECAPESVVVPASPPFCSPVPADIVGHAGAVAGPDNPGSAVPYVGLSSAVQDRPVRTEQGHYVFIGRVVSGEQLDGRLDEPVALLVMDRLDRGELQLESQARSELAARGDRVRRLFRTQLTMSASEYQSAVADAQATPTPASTPSPEPTPRSTETPTQTGSSDCQSNPGFDISLVATGIHSNVLEETHRVRLVAEGFDEDTARTGQVTVRGNGQVIHEECVTLGLDNIARVNVDVSRELGDQVELTANGQAVGTVKFSDPLSPVIRRAEFKTNYPGETAALELSVYNYADRDVTREFVVIGPGQNYTIRVTVPASGETTTQFDVQLPDQPGTATYRLASGDSNASIDVEERDTRTVTSGSGPGFTAVGVIVALLLLSAIRKPGNPEA